jgi:NCAIR mutase (PurE)-related protein
VNEQYLEALDQLAASLSANAETFYLDGLVSDNSGTTARVDLGREHRKGVPEIVLADTKSPEQIVAIVSAFLAHTGRAIISRVRPELVGTLREHFSEAVVEVRELARVVIVRATDMPRRYTGGRVGIISAGTSDIPVAEEARVIAEEMGCVVTAIYDVGVAGLHRLFPPLRTLLKEGVDAIVVAAGMDGALPSVVAGLVPVPVIGLPTSVGYGFGGQGAGALAAMLQTCVPGLAVVNIDNGVGAGATAALIANRVALARAAMTENSSQQLRTHKAGAAPRGQK